VTQSTVDDLIRREAGSREIVLSGIRATGELHYGNYFGAMKQFVEFAKGDNLCLFFIADWHTLTTCREPEVVRPNTLRIAMAYLAMGLDPNRAIMYGQSSVPEIAELAMYLSMLQNHAPLISMQSVEDMITKSTENNPFTLGKLTYPVLMAADILGPKSTVVPVGPDQVVNVELAADLARKFNNRFRSVFTIPTHHISETTVPGLDGEKMGKSANNWVSLLDSEEGILRKYQRDGVTDLARITKNIPGTPANCKAVFPLHEILLADKPEELGKVVTECSTAARGCVDCKRELARNLFIELAPFRERWAKLSEKPDFVREVLHYGGLKAREIITPTVAEVRECMGIFPN
jgi:tryptophanyl-tRNA synthetase